MNWYMGRRNAFYSDIENDSQLHKCEKVSMRLRREFGELAKEAGFGGAA